MNLSKSLFYAQIALFVATLLLFFQLAFHTNQQKTKQILRQYSEHNSYQHNLDEDGIYPYDRSQNYTFVSVDKLISSWKFTGDPKQNRDGVLIIKNICIDPDIGIFILDNQNLNGGKDMDDPPPVNLLASSPQYDKWWRPIKRYANNLTRKNKPLNITMIVNTTIFIIDTIWQHHYTHFFINNVFPLVQIHDEFYQNDFNFWLKEKRVLYVKNEIIDNLLDISFLNFMDVADQRTRFYFRGATDTFCFPHAVVGLNNSCDLGNHCKNRIKHKYYDDMRKIVRKNCLNQQEIEIQEKLDQQLIPLPKKLAIIQRNNSRYMLNPNEVSNFLTKKNITHEFIMFEMGWTMCDQVRYFGSQIGAFLALHGNSINNQLWLPPGGLIMEVRQYQYYSDFQELIFNRLKEAVKNLSYEVVQCEDISCALKSEVENPRLIHRDRSSAVNITRLEQVLIKHGWINSNQQ